MSRSDAAALARLAHISADRSHRGHFTTAEAERSGVGRRSLTQLVRRGVVVRRRRGLYRFQVGLGPTWDDELVGELLVTNGLACGATGAAAYGWINTSRREAEGRRFQILVARGARHASSPRHTTRDLQDWEIARIDGVSVLHPVRALLDAAHRLPRRTAVEMLEAAIVRNQVDPTRLEQRARELRHPKRPGCAVVLTLLGEMHPELATSRNEWEAWVVRRARELGLPEPRLEFEVYVDGARYLLDAAWPEYLVALEFDGRDPHMRRRVHDHDSNRRNALMQAGWSRFGITATALRTGDDSAFEHVRASMARALSA